MYKKVDYLYLKERILKSELEKKEITKIGKVTAKTLKVGQEVCIYFYDELAQIQTKKQTIKTPDMVMITKTIGSTEYNSVVRAIDFHKKYKSTNIQNEYLPIFDPFVAYELDENLTFMNCFGQKTSLCPGDFIVAKDALLEEFYGIYRYNLDDNYALVLPSQPNTLQAHTDNFATGLKKK